MNFLQKSIISLIVLLTFSNIAISQTPDVIKGLVWNRWTSKNFVVHSILNDQGEYLKNNLEAVKGWTLNRWGFSNIDFQTEVKLWCVGDKKLFEAIYPTLKESKVEIREENGRLKSIEAFLLLDDVPSRSLPMPLTEINMILLERQYNVSFGWWVHRGMRFLNGTESQIRASISILDSNLKLNKPIFLSKTLFSLRKEDYQSLSADERLLFDSESMVLVLMLRKEFGQDRLLHFIKSNDYESSLKTIYGFSNYDHFDKSLVRYMNDLTSDVASGKTPASYLLVQNANNSY